MAIASGGRVPFVEELTLWQLNRVQTTARKNQSAPSYVCLAAADSCYMSGQILPSQGGEIVNA